MSEEEIRKIAKEYTEMYFTKGIDSTKIFKYVDELEKEVEQLENIRKEVIEYINRKKYQPSPLGFELELNPKELYQLQNILNKGSEFNVKENNTNNN